MATFVRTCVPSRPFPTTNVRGLRLSAFCAAASAGRVMRRRTPVSVFTEKAQSLSPTGVMPKLWPATTANQAKSGQGGCGVDFLRPPKQPAFHSARDNYRLAGDVAGQSVGGEKYRGIGNVLRPRNLRQGHGGGDATKD